MYMQDVIYVNERDEEIGQGTIRHAVENGIIKRVVQVFLFNKEGTILIQKRTPTTPASPNRWNASTAGHVDVGETYREAMLRELHEEIGVADVALTEVGRAYMEEANDGIVRKYFCTVYSGVYDGPFELNLSEAAELKWVQPSELARWLAERPDDFTPSFIQGYRLLEHKDERS